MTVRAAFMKSGYRADGSWEPKIIWADGTPATPDEGPCEDERHDNADGPSELFRFVWDDVFNGPDCDYALVLCERCARLEPVE